eukprot:TRINITY_DN2627_c0_g1_i1.p1 TRINITY_DN2627_c0_g1~~TRINITY_DN2627_c0_g1_i1.p1  ORF type:complete len:268 (+),score=41.08 TRINITY_DN2627_c0_g1_i1:371-1174(+)
MAFSLSQLQGSFLSTPVHSSLSLTSRRVGQKSGLVRFPRIVMQAEDTAIIDTSPPSFEAIRQPPSQRTSGLSDGAGQRRGRELRRDSQTSTSATSSTYPFLPKPILGRRCVVRRTTAAAAAAALGMPSVERAEARVMSASATCELSPSASGISFCDVKVGTGEEASEGMLIKAHYTGKLLDGSVFDSSYNRGRPLVFRVGVGEVIRGWDQGILGTAGISPMKAGGKRTLQIPAELAYGARGAGCRGGVCTIPPNSTLMFDVEFIGKA